MMRKFRFHICESQYSL